MFRFVRNTHPSIHQEYTPSFLYLNDKEYSTEYKAMFRTNVGNCNIVFKNKVDQLISAIWLKLKRKSRCVYIYL